MLHALIQVNRTVAIHLARQKQALQCKVKNCVNSVELLYIPFLIICELNAHAHTYCPESMLFYVLNI